MNFSTSGKMLKSSGRRYSSSSHSAGEAVAGEEQQDEEAEETGENRLEDDEMDSSISRRWSSDPILSLGTRYDF